MKRPIVVFFALILGGTALSSEAAGADLQGVVVRAGGTEPVTKANIALQDVSENSRTFTAITSDAGKFIIRSGTNAGRLHDGDPQRCQGGFLLLSTFSTCILLPQSDSACSEN